jgi:predicted secreted protein
MLYKSLLVAVFLAALVTATSAIAHDAPPTYDRINFQVSATREVENDTLVATMYSERNGQQPSAMAGEVNQIITWAVDLARKESAIKVQTLNYQQNPVYKNQTVSGWRVRQSIRLESTDVTALSTLVGELQKRLAVASLRYLVSPDSRREAENALITEALGRFRQRGKLISAELERPGYRIVNIDVITSGAAPMRRRGVAAMAEISSVAAPTLDPGVQSVTVQVSGSIELKVPQ